MSIHLRHPMGPSKYHINVCGKNRSYYLKIYEINTQDTFLLLKVLKVSY